LAPIIEKGEATMALRSMEDLFLHTLKDIYYAERQILRTLPRMMKMAGSPELKKAFATHRDETEKQIERLQAVFESLDAAARGIKCEAIEGIIAEAEHLAEEIDDKDVLDAGLIGSAQAVEHYEMTRYGTLVAWAEQLGMKDAVKLLKETLEEERRTDRLLTELAEARINKQAAE
jgi:ferritin-like metal-binding protein YciE